MHISIPSAEYLINSLIPPCSTGTNDQFMKLSRELVKAMINGYAAKQMSLKTTSGKVYRRCF
jgi:hypothetical protein